MAAFIGLRLAAPKNSAKANQVRGARQSGLKITRGHTSEPSDKTTMIRNIYFNQFQMS